MTRSPDSSRRDAHGAASLVIITLLLMSSGLLVMYAARVALTEQRLTANDVLAHEALAAAQAGLEVALAGMRRFDLDETLFDTDGHFAIEGPAATLANGASYVTRLSNHGLTPWDATLLYVESQGTASDGIGIRLVSQLARRAPWLANLPPAPLVARGDVVLAAHGVLRNSARPYAIWSGGGVVTPGTELIEVAGTAPCPHHAICDDDAQLAALTPDSFFLNFFGRHAGNLRSAALAIPCAPCAAGDLIRDTDGGDRPLWIVGDAGTIVIEGGASGSPASPVLIVIDGDLVIGADTMVHGLIHVRGDWLAGAGSLQVQGAVIIEGTVQQPAGFTLEYDSGILDTLAKRGAYARIAGSWSDF